jgi:hypothetical protein
MDKRKIEIKSPKGNFVRFLKQIKDENELGLILQYLLGNYKFEKMMSNYYAYLSFLNEEEIEIVVDSKYILDLSVFRKKVHKVEGKNMETYIFIKVFEKISKKMFLSENREKSRGKDEQRQDLFI